VSRYELRSRMIDGIAYSWQPRPRKLAWLCQRQKAMRLHLNREHALARIHLLSCALVSRKEHPSSTPYPERTGPSVPINSCSRSGTSGDLHATLTVGGR